MTALYNEIDPYMAQWLRNLIAAGRIAPGVVWECSIEDIKPEDLNGFTQVHFFAGLGAWSLALRLAGIPDDYPIWSASCPCQPFSSAGAGAGFADERHLWPIVEHLARQCRPARIVGEQVASRDAEPWLDLVQTDMEALGYAFGAVAFPSASIGAPHIRDRTYWVADADGERRGEAGPGVVSGERAERIERRGDTGRLAYSGHDHDASKVETAGAGQSQTDRSADQPGRRGVSLGGLADAHCKASGGRGVQRPGESTGAGTRAACERLAGLRQTDRGVSGPINGFWSAADWLGCRDGKWRPVEPGSFPLAHGLPVSLGHFSAGERRLAEVAGLDAASLKRAKGYRTGVLSGAGNAINIEAARIFIECAFGTVRPVVEDLSDLI